MTSEMIIGISPHLRGIVPAVPANHVGHVMARQIDKALRFMHPVEREHLLRDVPTFSLVYDHLREK